MAANTGAEADVQFEIEEVKSAITKVEREIIEAEAKIQKVEDYLSDVSAQLQSSCLSADEKLQLRSLEEYLRTEKQQLRTEKQQLRTKEQQLRTKEQQLRTKEQLLRSEKQQLPSEKEELRTKEQELRTEKKRRVAELTCASAPRRLVDSAAKLRQLADNDIWELHYSSSVESYVDAAGVVDRIRLWAKTATRAAVETRRPKAPSPLLVSGLIKTGKSFTLEHMVPAVVAEELHKQGEKGPLAGMVVLRLKGDGLNREEGATAMLRDLLAMLVRWAREENVPIREGAVQAAQNVLAQPFFATEHGVPGGAIQDFLKAVEVPVLVLCDEVQSLFLPTINGKLHASGAEYIRNTFMKQLLAYGPHTVLWCLTGSSMVQTWISLANMPPNGVAVITSTSAANLPAGYSTEHMNLAWVLLQRRFPPVSLDPKLRELCPPSIALLAFLVYDWIDSGQPRDVAVYIRGFMRTKLIDESLKEWKLALEAMPSSQRMAILDLSSPGVGAQIDTDLHFGLQRFLEPHLDRKVDGRYYFRDPHQRQIVRLLFIKDGTLRESWSYLEFSASLTQLDVAWNLFRLGEVADFLLGPHASRRWEHEEPPAGIDEFKKKLQAIANEITDKLASDQGGAVLGPQELWERQTWFQKVLVSKWNNRDRDTYKNNKRAWCTHLAMLVFYLRLSRNVLAHMKPWDLEYGVMVDVNMIEALPRVLGQSVSVFNNVMVGALRVLTHRTVLEAAEEFEAQLSGGGSSGGQSSGTGGSSSGGQSSGTGGSGSKSSGTGGSGSKSSGGQSSGTGGSSSGGQSSGTGGSGSKSSGTGGSGSGGQSSGPGGSGSKSSGTGGSSSGGQSSGTGGSSSGGQSSGTGGSGSKSSGTGGSGSKSSGGSSGGQSSGTGGSSGGQSSGTWWQQWRPEQRHWWQKQWRLEQRHWWQQQWRLEQRHGWQQQWRLEQRHGWQQQWRLEQRHGWQQQWRPAEQRHWWQQQWRPAEQRHWWQQQWRPEQRHWWWQQLWPPRQQLWWRARAWR